MREMLKRIGDANGHCLLPCRFASNSLSCVAMHLPLKKLFIRAALLVVGFVSICHGDMTEKEIFASQKERVVVIESFNEWGQPTLQGSGVILGAEKKAMPGCEIVTNAHVIEGAEFILIRTFDKRTAHGEVVYFDRKSDVAILRSPFKPNVGEIERADKIEIGDKTVAIGSPKGLDWSLSSGIVSRIPSDEAGMVQTTAPISAGSSGGGLFDGSGKVIGITRGAIRDGQNLNFAVRLNGAIWKTIERYRSGESISDIRDVEWTIGHHEPLKHFEFRDEFLGIVARHQLNDEEHFALWLSGKWGDAEACERAQKYGDLLRQLKHIENKIHDLNEIRNMTGNTLQRSGVRIAPEQWKAAEGAAPLPAYKKELAVLCRTLRKDFPNDMESMFAYIRYTADPKEQMLLLQESEKRWPTKIQVVECDRASLNGGIWFPGMPLGDIERRVKFLRAFEKRLPESAPTIKPTERQSDFECEFFTSVKVREAINVAIKKYNTERELLRLCNEAAVKTLPKRNELPSH